MQRRRPTLTRPADEPTQRRGSRSKAAEPTPAPLPELQHAFTALPASVVSSWDVTSIRSAIFQHEDGDFAASSRLVYALGRDPRVAAALLQRVNTAIGLPLRLNPASRAWEGRPAAETIRFEAEGLFSDRSVCCPPSTQAWALAWQVMCGFAIEQVVVVPVERSDGVIRWTPEVRPWPTEAVKWNHQKDRFEVRTTQGLVPIEEGTGKWIIHRDRQHRPWMQGALRPLGLCWADRTYGIRDRSRRAAAMSLASFVGRLPEGKKVGTQESATLSTLLQGLQSGKAGIVIEHGQEIDTLELDAEGFKIFDSIISMSNDDIAMTLLGQSGTSQQKAGLGQGGNKVHDGVRYDVLESDVRTLYSDYTAQLVHFWTGWNFGRDELAPSVTRLVPDVEEDARLKATAERLSEWSRIMGELKAQGVDVDPQALAEQLGVTVPGLAETLKKNGGTLPARPAPVAVPAEDEEEAA